MKRKYRKMNEVHILKCDRDGDLTFTRTEMLCVSSIYQAMYLDQLTGGLRRPRRLLRSRE